MSTLSWVDVPSPGQREQIEAIIAAATSADGVAPVGEQVRRELGRDRTRHLIAVEHDRHVVGYLNLGAAMAELVVAPPARGHGIGTALLSSISAEPVSVWAHGDLPAAAAIARAAGLVPVRRLLQMRRSLRDLVPVEIPDRVTVRRYRGPDDDAELLRVNNAAFSWHPEQGGQTLADLAEQFTQPWFDPDGLFLAFDAADGDRLLGFHWTKVHPDGLGEVYVVGIDPDAQGRGLGRALTAVGLEHLAVALADQPDPTVLLYVEADNTAAVRTYERLGFEVFRADVAYARAPKPT